MTNEMTYSKQVCQGDVLIEACEASALTGLKQTPPTLARGEVTGHHHSFDDRHVTGFYKEGDAEVGAQPMSGGSPLAEFVRTDAPAEITHQEHGAIALTPGTYRRTIQREYSPEEIRNVAD